MLWKSHIWQIFIHTRTNVSVRRLKTANIPAFKCTRRTSHRNLCFSTNYSSHRQFLHKSELFLLDASRMWYSLRKALCRRGVPWGWAQRAGHRRAGTLWSGWELHLWSQGMTWTGSCLHLHPKITNNVIHTTITSFSQWHTHTHTHTHRAPLLHMPSKSEGNSNNHN